MIKGEFSISNIDQPVTVVYRSIGLTGKGFKIAHFTLIIIVTLKRLNAKLGSPFDINTLTHASNGTKVFKGCILTIQSSSVMISYYSSDNDESALSLYSSHIIGVQPCLFILDSVKSLKSIVRSSSISAT